MNSSEGAGSLGDIEWYSSRCLHARKLLGSSSPKNDLRRHFENTRFLGLLMLYVFFFCLNGLMRNYFLILNDYSRNAKLASIQF